jgi:hypothetical protein
MRISNHKILLVTCASERTVCGTYGRFFIVLYHARTNTDSVDEVDISLCGFYNNKTTDWDT